MGGGGERRRRLFICYWDGAISVAVSTKALRGSRKNMNGSKPLTLSLFQQLAAYCTWTLTHGAGGAKQVRK
jgi:hypothetical protein